MVIYKIVQSRTLYEAICPIALGGTLYYNGLSCWQYAAILNEGPPEFRTWALRVVQPTVSMTAAVQLFCTEDVILLSGGAERFA